MQARLLRIAKLLMQASQRAMRPDLQRLVIGELQRTLQERLRLAPQLLMQTQAPQREQQVRIVRTILLPALGLLN